MNKSKLKFSFAFLLAATSLCVLAQQDPYYSHFKFNKQAYNPATVGEKDDYICLSVIVHGQWKGYDDRTWIDRQTGLPVAGGELSENVAPSTYNINLNGQMRTNNGKMGGIGLSVFDDRIGFMKTTSFKLQGAFIIPLKGDSARISLGVDVGLTQFGYVNPKFRFRQPNNPRNPIGNIKDTKLDLGFGAYYKQKRLMGNIQNFYVGLSLSHLNGAKYNLNTPAPYVLAQHIYLGSGAILMLRNPKFELEPAVLIKYNSKLQFDLNTTVKYNGTYRGGLGFRQYGTSDAISIMLGYILKELQVGYSYDITLSKIKTVSTGTHEVFVGFCFQSAPD